MRSIPSLEPFRSDAQTVYKAGQLLTSVLVAGHINALLQTLELGQYFYFLFSDPVSIFSVSKDS